MIHFDLRICFSDEWNWKHQLECISRDIHVDVDLLFSRLVFHLGGVQNPCSQWVNHLFIFVKGTPRQLTGPCLVMSKWAMDKHFQFSLLNGAQMVATGLQAINLHWFSTGFCSVLAGHGTPSYKDQLMLKRSAVTPRKLMYQMSFQLSESLVFCEAMASVYLQY